MYIVYCIFFTNVILSNVETLASNLQLKSYSKAHCRGIYFTQKMIYFLHLPLSEIHLFAVRGKMLFVGIYFTNFFLLLDKICLCWEDI